MENVTNWFVENWDKIIQGVGYIYLGARVIVDLTPTNTDDRILSQVGRLLAKIVGLNINEGIQGKEVK